MENVGYFVGYNASSNDRLCASLSECTLLISLYLNTANLLLGFEKKHIPWPRTERRLRCNGHIINLTAQSFLFPDLTEVSNDSGVNMHIEGHLIEPLSEEKSQLELAEWRKKGPLGKVHNIVVFIQRSNQRIDAFKACLENPKHLGLIRDNDTRWNSWYNMLVRVLDLGT